MTAANPESGRFPGPAASAGETPVLFLIFNRKACAREVLDAIRQYRPRRFYVAGDGARNETERRLVEEIRTMVLAGIDWPCEVKTLFRDRNLGCRAAVSGAITWFFEHEEAGIILEDDCLPHPAFFAYCSRHLRLLQAEHRFASIAGCRPRCYPDRAGGSGSIARVFHCWGWAGWRRSWTLYHAALPGDAAMAISAKAETRAEARYWRAVLRRCADAATDSWDYRFALQCFLHDRRHLVAPVNLVLNLGFTGNASHTRRAPLEAPVRYGRLAAGWADAFQPDDLGSCAAFYRTQFRAFPARFLLRLAYAIRRGRSNEPAVHFQGAAGAVLPGKAPDS